MNNNATCITVVTDCDTGKPIYYEKKDLGEGYLKILQASNSLPFVAKPIHYEGRTLMDGGLSDSVPVRKSMEDGNRKNVLILTRPKGYRKKRPLFLRFAAIRYSRYKGLCEALASRHTGYNETMDFIDQLEDRGEVFAIRPRLALNVGRAERNKDKLYAAYDQGYSDAAACYTALCSYFNSNL